MTFPTDAATITVRKSFGICGPAIVAPSYFLGVIFQGFIPSRHAVHAYQLHTLRRAQCNRRITECPRDLVLILKSKPERPAFVVSYGTKNIGKAMGGDCVCPRDASKRGWV